jgi:hypothetical protein
MAVEDHPVHPSTIHNDMRYTACQQKVRKPGYYVIETKFPAWGEELRPPFQQTTWVPDTSSTGCRNVSFDTDPACKGCNQVRDMEYIEKMRNL